MLIIILKQYNRFIFKKQAVVAVYSIDNSLPELYFSLIKVKLYSFQEVFPHSFGD